MGDIEHLLRIALAEEGDAVSAVLVDERVELRGLDLTLTLSSTAVHPQTNVVSGEILATHRQLSTPLRFTAVGFGDDVTCAARSMAQQWFAVVFPVLHSAFADHVAENVSIAKITAVNEKRQRFGWRGHIGPVRVVFAGVPVPTEPDDGVVLHALKHEVTAVSAHRTTFWIDAFVARQGDGSVQSDCRLRNEYWPAAAEQLGAVAHELLPECSGFVSYRQFMLFQPTLPESTQSRGSWWRRFFRIYG